MRGQRRRARGAGEAGGGVGGDVWVVGCCEQCNYSLVFIKFWEFCH
jgi:hypothetical protein